MEWNEEKAQEIVQKHKKRFSLRLSLKIIRVSVLIILLYSVYMIAISIFYDSSKIGKRTEFYQKLAIDWTSPELSSEIGLAHTHEITPFLTQKINFPLEKRIGGKSYVVSQLELSKPLLTPFTTVKNEQNYPYESTDPGFHFYLPYDPSSGSKLSGKEDSDSWRILKMLHEGNVANLAFSMNDYYSPQEITEYLSSYRITVLWMPLYMGELQKFTEGGWEGWGGWNGQGSGDNTMLSQSPWGLSGARLVDEDFMGGSLINELDEESIEESQNAMIQNMQMMLKTKKNVAEKLLGTEYLQERVDYLNDEGFQAYGAVVTGPVKELLKLQELEEIHGVQLGEIKHWNIDGGW